MRIMICGSMSFAREMLQVKGELEQLEHDVLLPTDTESHVADSALIDDLERNHEHVKRHDVLRRCLQNVADSEAILVLNKEKNGLKGYIGTSTLMEMGLAYFLRKHIFVLEHIPSSVEARWAHEVRLMNPIIIEGHLERIRR